MVGLKKLSLLMKRLTKFWRQKHTHGDAMSFDLFCRVCLSGFTMHGRLFLPCQPLVQLAHTVVPPYLHRRQEQCHHELNEVQLLGRLTMAVKLAEVLANLV